MNSPLVFANGQLSLAFAMTQERFCWQSFSSAAGTEFLNPACPVALWEVELIYRNGDIKTLIPDAWPQVKQDAERLELVWALKEAAVKVTVDLPEKADAASWRIAVDQLSADCSVRQVHFPHFNWQLTSGENCKLILPSDAGLVYPDPLKTLPMGGIYEKKKLRRRQWPNGHLSLQFIALERDGELAYFGAHDLTGSLKSFDWDCDQAQQQLTFRPFWRTTRRDGAAYESFPWVTALSYGDWYDAAMRYRKFALQTPWVAKGPLSHGKKTPAWLIETPLVTLRFSRGEGWNAEDIKKEADFFGVPLLVHYYDWGMNQARFFPTLPGVRAELRKLNDYKIRFMPYNDAYSCSVDFDMWPQLKSGAVETDENGTIHAITWPPDNYTLASMCPGAPLWQYHTAVTALRCMEIGASGIYFDEYGMSPPWTCCSTEHDHEPGDPTAYLRNADRMLGKIKAESADIIPEGVVFSSEGAGEPFMSQIDTFLIGNGNSPFMKPIFAAVYHDYVMGFGRYIFFPELTDPLYEGAIESKFAEQFCCGWQFGWSRVPLNMVLEKSPETVKFIRLMARVRYEHRNYLVCGRMLRPLELEVPEIKLRWAMAWNDKVGQEVVRPAVLNSVWQADDTSLEVVFVNLTKTEITFNFVMPSCQLQDTIEDHAFKDAPEAPKSRTYTYPMPEPSPCYGWEYTDEGCRKFVMDGNTGAGFKVTIPPRGIVVQRVNTCQDMRSVHQNC